MKLFKDSLIAALLLLGLLGMLLGLLRLLLGLLKQHNFAKC